MSNFNTTAQASIGSFFAQWIYSYLTPHYFIKDQESIINGAYVSTNLGNLYPQSLLAIWLCRTDIPTAKNVLDNLNSLYTTYFGVGPGGMYNGYNTDTNTANTDSDRYIANSAWLLLACCHFAGANWGGADQNRYATMASGISTWIIAQIDDGAHKNVYVDGGVYSGYHGHTSGTPDTIISVKINESQSICAAALRAYSYFYGTDVTGFADSIEKFIFTLGGSGNLGGLFYPAQGRFYAGKSDVGPGYDNTHYFDNVCWAVMMLQDAKRLNYAFINGGVAVNKDLLLGSPYNGYTDKAGNARVFIESFAYLAIMMLKMYSINLSQSLLTARSNYLNNYNRFLIKSISFKGQGVPVVTPGIDYTGENTSIAAEPTLWYLLAINYINPLDPTFKMQ